MAALSSIGRGTVVRGNIRGDGDLDIHGRVEGSVVLTGDLLISETGIVRSDVTGRRVTVRGAVLGNISATEALVLEAGARVVGDIGAPQVGIRPGALLRGNVSTEGPLPAGGLAASASPGASRGRSGAPAARPAPARAPAPAARPAPAPRAAAAAVPAPSPSRPAAPPGAARPAPPAAAPAPRAETPATPATPPSAAAAPAESPAPAAPAAPAATPKPAASASAGSAGPPPPIVPAIGKGTRGSMRRSKGGR
jgi:cytoskeletal protein CcmA (bactofilin family)